jgi:hypothetical protein
MMNKNFFLTSFLIFIGFGLNAQNDFRKMNWYESSETLMEKYPVVEFKKETEMGMTAYSHFDYVGGIETRIAFCFINDEFVAGMYQFTPERSSYNAKDFVKDFDNISARLQSKYELERNDVWYKDNNIDVDLMGIDFYLTTGDVDMEEVGFDEGKLIVHSLKNSEGSITHMLMYATSDFVKKLENSLDNEF